MTWLLEHLATILSAAVAIWGLWTLVSQREATLEPEDVEPEDATAESWDAFSPLLVEVENGFGELTRVLRRNLAVVRVVLGVLVFASNYIPVPERISLRVMDMDGPDRDVYLVGQSIRVEGLVEKSGSRPSEDAPVVFLPRHNQGTVSPATGATDATGRVQTIWTLGSEAGEQRMMASVFGRDSAWITVQAMARDEPVPARIKITPDSAVLRSAGDIAPFSAEILDQYGEPFPGEVTWSSMRQCIFKAGSYGFAKALKSGTDSIVAAFDTVRATAPVTVRIGVP